MVLDEKQKRYAGLWSDNRGSVKESLLLLLAWCLCATLAVVIAPRLDGTVTDLPLVGDLVRIIYLKQETDMRLVKLMNPASMKFYTHALPAMIAVTFVFIPIFLAVSLHLQRDRRFTSRELALLAGATLLFMFFSAVPLHGSLIGSGVEVYASGSRRAGVFVAGYGSAFAYSLFLYGWLLGMSGFVVVVWRSLEKINHAVLPLLKRKWSRR